MLLFPVANYTKTHAGSKKGRAVAYNASARRSVIPDCIEIMPHNVAEPLRGLDAGLAFVDSYCSLP